MSSYIINLKNTSGEEGSIIADAGFNYTDKLNTINESNIKISGSSETKRGLIEIGSIVKIYRNGTLEFHGLVDNVDYFGGGAIAIHSSGYEKWLAMENGTYAGSPWTSTASATIFSAIIAEASQPSGSAWSEGTVEAGTSVDFRVQPTDSLWNALSNLKEATQQDIELNYSNTQISIKDHKGSSSSVLTLNAGIQMGDVRVSQSYPLGNDIRVYGKSEGQTRIQSDAAQGQDAASKSTYGIITKIIRDPKITTVAQANLVANAEVAKYKDPIKIYDFEVLNPSQSLVSGDVINLNSKSQGLSNEEVRIVRMDRGMRGGEEFLTLQVTNSEYSKLIKTTNELMAEAEKNARDQQTYDSYQAEYSNYNSATCVAGQFWMCNGVIQATESNLFLTSCCGIICLNVANTFVCQLDVVAGGINMHGFTMICLPEPTLGYEPATKTYVDGSAGLWADTTDPYICPCNSCGICAGSRLKIPVGTNCY